MNLMIAIVLGLAAFTPTPSDPERSCASRCGLFVPEASCQCNGACAAFDDCCPDLCHQCGSEVPSACGCLPSCDQRQCGSDGCDGDCGTCPGTSVCRDSECVGNALVCGAPQGLTLPPGDHGRWMEHWMPDQTPPALLALAEGHLAQGLDNPCDTSCDTVLGVTGAAVWLDSNGVVLARLNLHQPNPAGGGWRAEIVSRPPWTDVLGYHLEPGAIAQEELTLSGRLQPMVEELARHARQMGPTGAQIREVSLSRSWRGCRVVGYQITYTLSEERRHHRTRLRFRLDTERRLIAVDRP